MRIGNEIYSLLTAGLKNQILESDNFIEFNTMSCTSFKVPFITHPEAFLCPPPPKSFAISATLTLPFDLKLTLTLQSPISLNITATSIPLCVELEFLNPPVSEKIPVNKHNEM